MPTATVNGATLNYRVEGPDGAPWLTLSNSLAANLSMWDPQAEAFNADYRVLRYDTRGHGGSAPVGGDYSFDMLVGDVVGLWDALDIGKSHFCGLSLGGMTGIGLALGHAGRLDKAVICDCRADAPPFFVDMWVERRAGIQDKGIDAVVEGNLERWFTPEYLANPTPLLDDVRAMIRTTSNEGFLGCTAALMKLDYLPRLGGIGVPALYVVGANDGPHPEVMQAMHERTPGSQFAVIDNAAHLANLEQPAAFNKTVAAFLAS